jgi:hypothetical protein
MPRASITCCSVSTIVLASALALTGLAPATAAPRNRPEAPPVPAVQVTPSTPDPLIVVVSLRKQKLTVFNRNGSVTTSPVSSGTAEFPTPTGVFSVIGKAVEHESNIYEGASMPFMQRLTWTGTAMHAGHLPGYPASHGCIRLPYAFSEKLFEMTQINTRVIVTRDDVAPQPVYAIRARAGRRDANGQLGDQPCRQLVGYHASNRRPVASAWPPQHAPDTEGQNPPRRNG